MSDRLEQDAMNLGQTVLGATSGDAWCGDYANAVAGYDPNPYAVRQVRAASSAAEPPPAGAMTVADIEVMFTQRLEAERARAYREQMAACGRAWEEGRDHGGVEGRRAGEAGAQRRVDNLVSGRLQHVAFELQRWAEGGKKTTIAAEREVMAAKADKILQCCRLLSDIGELPYG